MKFTGLRSKKGNFVMDSIVILVFVIIFAICALFISLLFTTLNTEIGPELTEDSAASSFAHLYGNYASFLDNGFLFAFVFFALLGIVGSYFVAENPLFLTIVFVVMVALLLAGIFLANAYDDFATDPELAQHANNFTYIPFILNNFLQVAITCIFASIIAMFVGSRT